MLGLETALSVVVATMVAPGLLDWRGVARVMSENPARIVGLDDQGRRSRWVNRPIWLSSTPISNGLSTGCAGEPVGEHAVSGDDVAGEGDGNSVARQGDRPWREVS